MAGGEKIDFRKTRPDLFAAPKGEWQRIDLPPVRYLMADGEGAPYAPAYQNAVEALYSTAYPLKFLSKKVLGRDYVVPPLEGLWWSDDLHAFTQGRREAWRWTMMLMLPDWLTDAQVAEGLAAAREKRPENDFSRVRPETLHEGLSLQRLHIGSYADEAPLLADLHDAVMPGSGFTFNGHHHEVYLGDPRRTAPEKLRTILRQPVRPA